MVVMSRGPRTDRVPDGELSPPNPSPSRGRKRGVWSGVHEIMQEVTLIGFPCRHQKISPFRQGSMNDFGRIVLIFGYHVGKGFMEQLRFTGIQDVQMLGERDLERNAAPRMGNEIFVDRCQNTFCPLPVGITEEMADVRSRPGHGRCRHERNAP
ncbi:MAG: hypothetical protein FD153_1719 [Rhodospirillaceae bacterium]|nr:MAG: hypothetical protein FD153_1719 [Rhodospirillaceae bacterium]